MSPRITPFAGTRGNNGVYVYADGTLYGRFKRWFRRTFWRDWPWF